MKNIDLFLVNIKLADKLDWYFQFHFSHISQSIANYLIINLAVSKGSYDNDRLPSSFSGQVEPSTGLTNLLSSPHSKMPWFLFSER